MLLTRVWGEQPGAYFCISTKDRDGEWHDEFFSRKQFPIVQAYIDEKKASKHDIFGVPTASTRSADFNDMRKCPSYCGRTLMRLTPGVSTN